MKKKLFLLKSIIGFSVASWISAGLNFFILPISTRVFLPEDLAKINLFYSVVTILMTVSCMGIDQGYMRFYHEKEDVERSGLLTWCIRSSAIWLSIILILSLPFRRYVGQWLYGEEQNFVVFHLYICALCLVIYRYISILYRMENRIVGYTIVAIVSSAVIKFSYLLAAIFGGNYVLAIRIMSLMSGVVTILIAIIQKEILKTNIPAKSIMTKEFFKFSIPLFPIGFMVQLNNYLPQFIIRNSGDFNNLGVFSSAVTLAGIVTLIQSGINIFWSPYVLKKYKNPKNDIKEMQNLLSATVISFALLIMMFGDVIVRLLGDDYQKAIVYLPFLLLIPICYTLAEVTGIGIIISKKSYLNIKIYFFTICMNLLLASMFIRIWGAVGVAVASGLSATFMLLVKTVTAQKYYTNIENKKRFYIDIFLLLVACFLNTILYKNMVFKIVVNLGILVLIILPTCKMWIRKICVQTDEER